MAQPPPLSQQNGRTPSASSMRSLLSQGTPGRVLGTLQLNEADNIKVAIRIRPINNTDKERGSGSVLQVYDATTLKVVVPGPAKTTMTRDFTFHACLGPDVMQPDVLTLCGVPQLLDAALAGYNVTIFAYGQTGSGKTYTMSGREDVIESEGYAGDMNDGIITRSVSYLYSAIAERARESRTTLSASYLEIYNEGIYDLLNLKAKNLPVKWDAGQGFFVPGLQAVECANMPAMLEVIRTGMRHRHVGSHELNIESSRSHSIMTIACRCRPTGAAAGAGAGEGGGVQAPARFGKISFVDLAGSERLKDTKSEGVMLKETANINKSLFVLGKVIAALADRDAAGISAHIPYRDSKLTKLLMDSLGGSALALMIACCSPSAVQLEETLSTLSYATRAKNITNRPTVQFDPREAATTALRREIELLRSENAYLRDQMSGGLGPMPLTPGGAASPILNHSLRSQLALISTNFASPSSSMDLLRPPPPPPPPLPAPSKPTAAPPGSPSPHASSTPTNSSGNRLSTDPAQLANLLSCARRHSGSITLASIESPGSGPNGAGGFGSGFGNGELGSRRAVLGAPLASHPNHPPYSILASAAGSGGTLLPLPSAVDAPDLSHASSSPMGGGSGGGPGGEGFAFSGSGAHGGGGSSAQSAAGQRQQQQQQPGASHAEPPVDQQLRQQRLRLRRWRWRRRWGLLPPPVQEQDLLRRLKDTQSLLSRFSEENVRLARENDKLTAGRSTLGEEHADVLDEIDALRGKLADLETAVVTGVATPAAARSLLLSGMHAGAAGTGSGGGGGSGGSGGAGQGSLRVTGSGYGSARTRTCPDGADLTQAVAAYYSGGAADNTSSHAGAARSHSTRSTGGGGAHDPPDTNYPYLSNGGGGGATLLSQSQSPSYRSLSSHLPPGQPLTHQQPPPSSHSQLNAPLSNQPLLSQYAPQPNQPFTSQYPPLSHQPFTSQQHHHHHQQQQQGNQLPWAQHPPPMPSQPPSQGSPDTLPRLRHSIMTARPASLSDMRAPPHVGLGPGVAAAAAAGGEAAAWGGLAVPALYRSGSSSMPWEEAGGPPVPSPGHAPWGQVDRHRASSTDAGSHPPPPPPPSCVTQCQDQARRSTASDPSRPQQPSPTAAATASATGRIAALLAEADLNALDPHHQQHQQYQQHHQHQQHHHHHHHHHQQQQRPGGYPAPSHPGPPYPLDSIGGGGSGGGLCGSGDRSTSASSGPPPQQQQQQQWSGSHGGQRFGGAPAPPPSSADGDSPWRGSRGNSVQGTVDGMAGSVPGSVETTGGHQGAGPYPPTRTAGAAVVVPGGRASLMQHGGSSTADVLSMAVGPGASTRTRQAAGRGHSYGMAKPKADDSLIIVADPAKLSLLLG
ncbi:MAG: hypothetical protein WDW36_009583 [Sanguina aurantia]